MGVRLFRRFPDFCVVADAAFAGKPAPTVELGRSLYCDHRDFLWELACRVAASQRWGRFGLEPYFSGIGIGNGITLPTAPRASLIFGVPRRSTSSMRTIECIGTKLRTTPSN